MRIPSFWRVRGIAFDAGTGGHFAGIGSGGFFRLGGSGCITETVPIPTLDWSGDLCFDADRRRFALVYRTEHDVVGREAIHGEAENRSYGASCEGLTLRADNAPYAGHSAYRLICTGARPYRDVVLLVGTSDVGAGGLGECRYLVGGWLQDPPPVVRADATGRAVFSLSLPCSWPRNLYLQAVNPSALSTSNAIHARIRP